MSVAFVKEFTDASGADASPTLTTATSVAIGDLILVQIDWDDTTPRTISTVDDNAGGGSNVYTKISTTLAGTLGGTNFKSEVWWAKAKATATLQITGHLSGVVPVWEMFGTEFSGQDPTTPIDNFHSATGVGTAPSHAITTVADNSMIYGVAIVSGAVTTPAGYTSRSTFDGNSLVTRTAVKTPAGAETVTWGTARDWLSWLVSIQPPGSGAVAALFAQSIF